MLYLLTKIDSNEIIHPAHHLRVLKIYLLPIEFKSFSLYSILKTNYKYIVMILHLISQLKEFLQLNLVNLMTLP